jgi:hypothetical protein
MDVAHQLAWRKMNGEDLPAADIKKLWDLQRGGPFMLLAGLAVENLLKAIWVKQHPGDDVLFESDSDGKRRLSRKLTHHRLGDLAQAVGFSPTAEERGLFQRLQHHVEWAGKYPVGTDHFLPLHKGITQDPFGFRAVSNLDFRDVCDLVGRLRPHL